MTRTVDLSTIKCQYLQCQKYYLHVKNDIYIDKNIYMSDVKFLIKGLKTLFYWRLVKHFRMTKLTLDQRAEIKMAFRTFDPNKTEIISKKDFQSALNTMGFFPTDQEIDGYMRDKPNGMDYVTFKTISTKYILNRTQKQELKRMFLMFDTDHDGYISIHNLADVCRKCGDKTNEAFMKRMIEDFDKSGRGRLDEHDFIKIFAD